MDTEIGRNMILWTVRLSLALYVVAVWRLLFGVEGGAGDRKFTAAWSLSWLLCVIHVVSAFHFEHRWSHQAALQHTAEMTERVVGIRWAVGVYINYLFLAWRGTDLIRLLRGGATRSSASIQWTAPFMMFNATVVFGPRWWVIPAIVFAIFAAVRFHRRMVQQKNAA
jgi:hypothetical protein